jgi:hypothetical protein
MEVPSQVLSDSTSAFITIHFLESRSSLKKLKYASEPSRIHSCHFTLPALSMSFCVPRKVHPRMQLLRPRITGNSEYMIVQDGDITTGQHLGNRHCNRVSSRVVAFGESRFDCPLLDAALPQSWQVLSWRMEQRDKQSRQISSHILSHHSDIADHMECWPVIIVHF